MNFTKYNTSAEMSMKYDAGLRAYMIKIFNLMAIALAVTGFTSYFASNSEVFFNIMYTKNADGGQGISPLGWVIQLAPLFMVFFFSYKINSISEKSARMLFWTYSVLMGLALSPIFLMYTGESIARTFFISASIFGAMSIYGYTTKKDLTSMGSFLIMGVIGILLASVVNMFMGSSALAFAISVIGVIIFTGLTAYDVQKLKNIYLQSGRMNEASLSKVAISGALTLYLDFINLFLMLLRLMGDRR
jgi:uncharacterized protein